METRRAAPQARIIRDGMIMEWTNRKLAVDSRLLLAFNAVIPIVLVLIAVDGLFLNGLIKAWLPSKPEDYIWFAFVFNFPHIMGSMVTFAEKDYMIAYGKPLILGSIVIILGSLLAVFVLGQMVYFALVGFFTIYHLIMQQYGIALMFAKRRPDMAYQIWRWLSVAAGGLMYLSVYTPGFQNVQALSVVATAISMPFGAWFFWRIAQDPQLSKTTKWYFAASYAIIPATCVACAFGYPFLLVIIPRLIHDATAFTVYAVHDHNRNLNTKHNLVYRLLAPLRVSPALLCLPLAIGLSWYFTAHQYESAWVMAFLLFFALLHYYMEGYMWKRGMPHRENVVFHIA